MKELPYHGVYLVKNGKLQLLDRDPGGAPPQGIALSSDEKTLYVTNTRMFEQIFAYDVQPDDTVKNRRLFIDLVGEQGLGGPDGLCVDTRGNVYTAATGGLWIISPAGKRLGKVPAPEGIRFASLAFGEPDPQDAVSGQRQKSMASPGTDFRPEPLVFRLEVWLAEPIFRSFSACRIF